MWGTNFPLYRGFKLFRLSRLQCECRTLRQELRQIKNKRRRKFLNRIKQTLKILRSFRIVVKSVINVVKSFRKREKKENSAKSYSKLIVFEFFHPESFFVFNKMNFTTQLLWRIVYRNEWLQFRQGKVFLSIYLMHSSHCAPNSADLWTILLILRRKKKSSPCPLFEWNRRRGDPKVTSSFFSLHLALPLTLLQLNQL